MWRQYFFSAALTASCGKANAIIGYRERLAA
jgi:hypothetical protein